jgi:hypothetical protein
LTAKGGGAARTHVRPDGYAVHRLSVARRQTRCGGMTEFLTLKRQNGRDKRAFAAPFDDLNQVVQ